MMIGDFARSPASGGDAGHHNGGGREHDSEARRQQRAGKPAVRNFREGNGNVGIMRSPLRAIALPDQSLGRNLPRRFLSKAQTGSAELHFLK